MTLYTVAAAPTVSEAQAATMEHPIKGAEAISRRHLCRTLDMDVTRSKLPSHVQCYH